MPRNTISRCAHTTAPLSVSLLHTLVPYFFSFSISSIALSLFTPNSRPFFDNVVSLVSSLFTNILVFIVFSRFSFYYINFFDHYFQPYSSLSSISRTALLFFFAFTFLFYFHDLIRRRRRSTCIVHSLAAGSRWEAKPSITPNPLEFLSRACVQWNDTRRVRIHSARTTRRAAFIRNTDVQHDKCVKANKTRVYISFEIGVPLILIELYTSPKTVFFAVQRTLKCVGHTCTYAYNKCKWTCANRIAGVAKGQTERS